MTLDWISTNTDGNIYVGYKVEVKRGIRGKTKGKVNELIIVGMHKSKFKDFCENHNIDYDMLVNDNKDFFKKIGLI